MKLKTLFYVGLLLFVGMVQATPLNSLSGVYRYTDLGGGQAHFEGGVLYATGEGFVPTADGDHSLDVLGLTQATLDAIDGKTVLDLNSWMNMDNAFDLSKFTRSSAVYTIDGGSSVIVSLKSAVPDVPIGIGDEVLELSQSGIRYCAGLKPQKLTPKTDVDLWFKVNDESSATLYSDAGLTQVVSELHLDTAAISGKAASFSAMYADAQDYLAIVGTFTLDGDGYIKSLKATMLQRDVIESCYTNTKISGKRFTN